MLVVLKNVLFLFFLFSAEYFLVPPPTPTPIPSASCRLQAEAFAECGGSYSPPSCRVTNYDFTFIYDDREKVFKVHGLWPEQCAECMACGYPSCCNMANISYVYPTDPDQVTFLSVRWFNATTKAECYKRSDNKRSDLIPLFEHEFFKHASCTPFRQSASEFVQQVMQLYDKYYVTHVENQCSGYKQLWLNLDGNFGYNNVTKCI